MSIEAYAGKTLEDAFPTNVDPMFTPFGSRVLLQLRRAQEKTKSGLILIEETKAEKNWNEQVAMVKKLGHLAFRNRNTMEEWPEGAWCKVGEFVNIPRWGGHRWTVEMADGGSPVQFVVLNDTELFGRVDGDPLTMPVKIL